MKKCLILILGEYFRDLTKRSVSYKNEEVFQDQHKAILSHVDFINFIKSQHNISPTVVIKSYKNYYESCLIDFYKSNNIDISSFDFFSDLKYTSGLFNLSINSIEDINIYDFILYIRPDLELKTFFKKVFNPDEKKILFPSVCFSFNSYHIQNNLYPRVSDTITFIPKNVYNRINLNNFFIGHESWEWLLKNGLKKEDDLIGTFLKTLHDSDSAKDWNPIYRIVNRAQQEKWHDCGKEINLSTLEIYKSSKFLSKNDF